MALWPFRRQAPGGVLRRNGKGSRRRRRRGRWRGGGSEAIGKPGECDCSAGGGQADDDENGVVELAAAFHGGHGGIRVDGEAGWGDVGRGA